MASKASMTDRQGILEDMRELLSPGDVVYTKVLHVSQSGMYRVIDLYVIRNNEPRRISWPVGRLLQGYDRRHEGARASGCGMDMGFALVYDLSSRLFPDGFECIGEHCPADDHVNMRRGETPTHHRDGGYALIQRWL